VIGLSVRPAYAYNGSPTGTVSAAAIGELVHVGIGRLYALRVPKGLPSQVPAVPEIYKAFNVDDYVLLPNEKTGKRMLRKIGCVEVA
jgi:hypothetical protein